VLKRHGTAGKCKSQSHNLIIGQELDSLTHASGHLAAPADMRANHLCKLFWDVLCLTLSNPFLITIDERIERLTNLIGVPELSQCLCSHLRWATGPHMPVEFGSRDVGEREQFGAKVGQSEALAQIFRKCNPVHPYERRTVGAAGLNSIVL